MTPVRLNSRLLDLPQSGTVALADRVRRLRAEGRDIVPLQTGDPDFATPEPIIEAARRAMLDGLTHYSFSRGLPELREAIAETMRHHGAKYDPGTEILVTCGGVHAYYCALQAITNPGDEILVPDPAWMTHVNMAAVVDGVAVPVPARAEDDFFPTMEAWESAVTPNTVALVINSPNNPTGCVATRDYLEQLLQFAQRHSLYVISDEVYDHILFDGREHTCFSALPGAQERTLLINSLSKTYAMTGWRVGWLAGPEKVIELALKVGQNSITNLAPFIQKAATFALMEPTLSDTTRDMTREYEQRRDDALELWAVEGIGSVCPNRPGGAFYLFWDVRALNRPVLDIAESLLEDAGLAVVPGSVFGRHGEGFIRMTLAAGRQAVLEGTIRMVQWCRKNEG